MYDILEKTNFSNKWIVSKEELKEAIATLGNKAVGLDGLKDINIKQCLTNDTTLEKCRSIIQKWLNSGSIPAYLKHSRLIALSKS